MTHRLSQAALSFRPGESIILPLSVQGLPPTISALGQTWRRKREFHLTVAAADVLGHSAAAPEVAARIHELASARTIVAVTVGTEVRRAVHPDNPGLETLVVMAQAPWLAGFCAQLGAVVGKVIEPLPAHVTLYTTAPDEGIGLSTEGELAERAPALSEADQQEVRGAMMFDRVFFDDDGIHFDPAQDRMVALGKTDATFTPRVLTALAYAAHVQHNDLRKATRIPYLAHLISVAALVAEDGGGEIEVMAALLHDTAEDHGGERRLADILRRFGPDVEKMVRGLSDSLREEGEEKQEWRVRKQAYLAHLRELEHAGTLRVSNADKLHNARAILADFRDVGAEVWKRFKGSGKDQLWYYGQLAEIFTERRGDSPLARELARVVGELRAEFGARSTRSKLGRAPGSSWGSPTRSGS